VIVVRQDCPSLHLPFVSLGKFEKMTLKQV